MKRTIQSATFSIAMAAIMLTGCIEDVVDTNPPVISVTAPEGDTTTVIIGQTVDFVLDLTSGNKLASFQALSNNAGVELSNSNKTFSNTNVETLTVTATVGASVTAGTVVEISFVLADAYKQSTKKKYILAKAATTPLSEAKSFEWKRVGGAAGTGLETFGLSWTDNTTNNAVIRKGATKFVELTPAQWTSITNKEALKTAIDAATNIDKWEKVSATDASKTYDLALGTIKDNKYFLIHVTKSTVTVTDVGSTISITGHYKD
jgi:hypothetical protein